MATQTTITREVKNFQHAQGLNVSGLAKALGYSRSALNDRLRGRTRWNANDLDTLIDAGVAIELSAYSVFDSEAVGA